MKKKEEKVNLPNEKRKKNIECINKRRKKLKDENLDDSMKLKHIQAAGELSGKHTINNRALKKWNSSIYDYHSKTNEFRLKEEFKNKTSYAMPKKIKWN